MQSVAFLLTGMWFVLTSTHCDAGGLFRRVPEVGEWATFTYSSTREYPSRPPRERHFTLTVKCVGEEIIDTRQHLWIEWKKETSNEIGETYSDIHKALVAENVFLDAEPSLDGIRGWAPSPVSGGGPIEFSALDGDLDALAALQNVVLVFVGGGESIDSEQGERTIEVNGQEHVLTRSESGPRSMPYESETVYIIETSEGTYWLSEDLAFGVAAAEITSSHVHREREDDEQHLEGRFELIATGTGAVSDLPDHN